MSQQLKIFFLSNTCTKNNSIFILLKTFNCNLEFYKPTSRLSNVSPLGILHHRSLLLEQSGMSLHEKHFDPKYLGRSKDFKTVATSPCRITTPRRSSTTWRCNQCDQIWRNVANLAILCKSLGNF